MARVLWKNATSAGGATNISNLTAGELAARLRALDALASGKLRRSLAIDK